MATPQDRAAPTTAAIAIASAIVAGVLGFFIGQFSTLGSVSNAYSSSSGGTRSAARKAKSSDTETDSDDDADARALTNALPTAEECKLVLVVRTDLGMTKGKIAAQCSHATLACYKYLLRRDPGSELLRRWERLGQAKVALQVKSEEELEMLQARAISLGLCAQIIHDAGRTQIASGSATVLGVGPGPKTVVDQVTGHLKLL